MANNGRGETAVKETVSGSLKPEFNSACHCEPEQSSGVAIHSMTQSLSNADRRCNDTAQNHFRQPENINENAHNAYGVASTPNGVSVDCHAFASQNLAMTQEEKNLSGNLKPEFNPACHCEPEQSSGVAIHSMTQSLSNADRRCNDTAQNHFRQPENINENAHNSYGVASTPNGVSVDYHDFASQNLAMTPVTETATPLHAETTLSGSLNNTSVILNDREESLSNSKDFSPVAPNDGNISGSLNENTPLDLPKLTPDNWHIIVQKLTPQLGANVLLAQHSSLVKVEDNQITLSVHKSGELFCKPAHLSALGEVLAQHYGTQKNIQVIEWQDNFESASQAKQRHKKEQQQQRLIELQQDPFAQKLQQVFGGEWTVSS